MTLDINNAEIAGLRLRSLRIKELNRSMPLTGYVRIVNKETNNYWSHMRDHTLIVTLRCSILDEHQKLNGSRIEI